MYTSYICEYNVYKHTSVQAERNFEIKDIKQHFKTFDFNFIFKKIVLLNYVSTLIFRKF